MSRTFIRTILGGLAVVWLGLLGADFADAQRVPSRVPGRNPEEDALTEEGGTLPDVYDDATAVWTFNQHDFLGMEGNDSANGNATYFDISTTQHATTADHADFDLGSGVSYGFVGWISPVSSSATVEVFTKGNVSAEGEYTFYVNSAGKFACAMHDGAGGKIDNGSAAPLYARSFVHCRYNATANELEAGVNATWTGSPIATAGDGIATTDAVAVGARLSPSPQFPFDGVIGPVAFYRSASGGEILTDAMATSIYNNGRGKQCASMSGDELTNLISCWDLDEASGDLVDSVASHDFTRVNAPTQTTGLILTGTGDPALDLTEVNVPTATGGALGYATDFEVGSAQYASVADNPSLSLGDGVSYGFAAWVRPETISTARAVLGNLSGSISEQGEFDGYLHGSDYMNCSMHDGAATRSDNTSPVLAIEGAREFLLCRYDATANELEAGLNAVWSGSPVSTSADGADLAYDINIGAAGAGQLGMDGVQGPVLWYRSASGGQILTDAIATSLYNSGKGKACADLSGAELTNLVSCWEMNEDGGPYLNAVSAAVADYATDFSGSGQYATIADNASFDHDGATSLGYCTWIELDTASANDWFIGKSSVGGEYYSQMQPDVNFVVADSSSGTSTATCTGCEGSPYSRSFYCMWYDASDKKAYISKDGATPTAGSALTNGLKNNAENMNIAGPNTKNINGTIGPVWFYNGGVPDYASLYNGGIGKTCDDTTETANLVSCWDMDEATGGPYADSVGSNTLTAAGTPTQVTPGLVTVEPDSSGCLEGDCDLTAVNAPTRVAGLVEQDDSGMAAWFVGASAQYLTITTNDLSGSASTGVWNSFWFIEPVDAANTIFNNIAGTTGVSARWTGSAVQCVFYDDGGSSNTAVATASTHAPNVWGFGNCYWDPATGYGYATYDDADESVSGQSASTFTLAPQTAGNTYRVSFSSDSWDGAIDNVAHWSRPPAAGELAGLWNSGSGDFYASAWFDWYLNGPYYADLRPIMLEPQRFPIPWRTTYAIH